MSDSPFELFRVLPSLEEAEAMGQILKAEGIAYQIDKATSSWYSARSGVVDANSRMLLIPTERFGDANSLLELQTAVQDIVVDDEHYLNDFGDDELIQIVAQKHEWSTHDYLAAIKLLDRRGVSVDLEQIAELQEENLRRIREPKKVDKAELSGLALKALFGGPVGIFAGYSYWQSEKTDPTGEKYFEYDEQTRHEGALIFSFGILSSCIWIAVFVMLRSRFQ